MRRRQKPKRNPLNEGGVSTDTSFVKVTGFRELFQIHRTLKANAEGGDGHGAAAGEQGGDRQPQQDQNPDQSGTSPSKALSPEQERMAVEQAVSDFQSESKNQQHGLNAALSGNSPGLRVVLSDINGNVIRQFEADEFLRLRASGNSDTRGRGKLLDQKF